MISPFNKEMYCNHYEINISIANESKFPQIFDFYGSHNDYMNGKTELTESDLLDAFSCILRDAECGLMSFDEFCSDLGYNNDSIKDQKVWLSCAGITQKILELLPGNDHSKIYKIFAQLDEMING
jgi:hypothetical protein